MVGFTKVLEDEKHIIKFIFKILKTFLLKLLSIYIMH
jgi:hypothetical protein